MDSFPYRRRYRRLYLFHLHQHQQAHGDDAARDNQIREAHRAWRDDEILLCMFSNTFSIELGVRRRRGSRCFYASRVPKNDYSDEVTARRVC